MKFIIAKSIMRGVLEKIKDLPTGKIIPVMETVLLDVLGNGTVTIIATDMETTAQVTVKAEVSSPGQLCVNAKMLLNILKSMDEQPIVFEHLPKASLRISGETDKFTISGIGAEEFPEKPSIEIEGAKCFTISGKMLQEGNEIAFCAGNDNKRPLLSAINMNIEDDKCTFAATDAHRLITYTGNSVQGSPVNLNVCRKALNIVCRFAGEKVTVHCDNSFIMFVTHEAVIISRLIEGGYPAYQNVIPKENSNVLTIKKRVLLSAIRKAAITANKSINQVRFSLNGVIKVSSGDDANNSEVRLPGEYKGNEIEIGFNAGLLASMVRHCENEEINLKMSTPAQAVLIEGGQDKVMLIMPLINQ